jgi:hypothetical protein
VPLVPLRSGSAVLAPETGGVGGCILVQGAPLKLKALLLPCGRAFCLRPTRSSNLPLDVPVTVYGAVPHPIRRQPRSTGCDGSSEAGAWSPWRRSV